MEEKEKENEERPEEKTQWQLTKEGWYDKIPLTLKQLDIIIGVASAALFVVFILIILDAAGVF